MNEPSVQTPKIATLEAKNTQPGTNKRVGLTSSKCHPRHGQGSQESEMIHASTKINAALGRVPNLCGEVGRSSPHVWNTLYP